MSRQTIVAAAVAAAVSSAVSFGAASASNSPTAHVSASDPAVVNGLRSIKTQLGNVNAKLDVLNKTTGGYTNIAPGGGTVLDLLKAICAQENRANGGFGSCTVGK
jgi:hypothetical protein